MNHKIFPTLTLVIFTLFNSACTTVGPNYQQPNMPLPKDYKESAELSPMLIEQHWWEIYQDPILNQLIAQIELHNYSLQANQARLRQALSNQVIAQASQSPNVIAGGKNDLGIVANWEVDLWGRIQRNIEANGALAEASAADLAAAKLALQAQLTQNYFLLRLKDKEISLLQNTVSSYQRSLQITQNQYKAGVTNKDNLAQEQAQLSAALVQMNNAQIDRAKLEHSIAVLVGQTPREFSLEPAPIDMKVPQVPLMLPSKLLERRPDIAAAERRMAAASAKIGIAEAEAYPSLSVFAGVSIRKGLLGGGELSAPLYTAYATQARRKGALGVFDESVANYKQTILNSFREVEDNLVELQILQQASQAQAEVVKAGREVVGIMNNQYQAGVVNYQSIIIAQASALTNERSALALLGRRMLASVNLIKALGGGWDVQENNLQPTEQQLTKDE